MRAGTRARLCLILFLLERLLRFTLTFVPTLTLVLRLISVLMLIPIQVLAPA